MLLILSVHPSRLPDLLTPQQIRFDPLIPARDYGDRFDNICTRIVAPSGRLTIAADLHLPDSGAPDLFAPEATQVPVEELPDEVLVYLLGSRYCETARRMDTARSRFGEATTGWRRCQANCDHLHEP